MLINVHDLLIYVQTGGKKGGKKPQNTATTFQAVVIVSFSRDAFGPAGLNMW